MRGDPRCWRVLIHIVAVWVAAGCESQSEEPPRQPTGAVEEIAGEVLSVIDGAIGTPFGRISSLAVMPGGVVALDDHAQEVYWIGRDGTTVERAGRRGDGPGELKNACCISVSAGRTLLVFSPNLKRVDRFKIGANTLEFDSRVVVNDSRVFFYRRPPVSLPDARILIAAELGSGSNPQDPRALLEVDTGGRVVGRRPLPSVPIDSLSVILSERSGRSASIGLPYGRRFLEAYAPSGSVFAYGLTSSRMGYEITLRTLKTEFQKSIRQNADLVPLTATQQKEIDTFVARYRAATSRAGTTVTVRRPSSQPVIRNLWFDNVNRLWVERFLPADLRARADVYSKDGDLLFRANWPRGVDLSMGALTTQDAWGVARDSLGVERLVHIVFSSRQALY